MPFRRREPVGFSEKIRDLFWPRTGFRSLRYMKLRLLRLSASPHSVAAGVAIGVGVAWTPFLGVHIIIAMALGFLLRVNLVAAALGTTFANPLTFPFIWASTWGWGTSSSVGRRRKAPRMWISWRCSAILNSGRYGRRCWSP